MKHVLSPLILSVCCFVSIAQGQIVDQLIAPVSLEFSGGNVVMVFDDFRPDTTNTNFEAQHTDNVTRWTAISGGLLSQVGDRYTLSAPEPPGPRKFYRIIGYSTTAEDSDGDGLADTFEATFGTLTSKADTDGDGFTDGQEFLYGTDANDAGIFPVLTTDPRIEFALADSLGVEGEDGGHQVTLVSDQPFSGMVNVKVGVGSTAVAGTDFNALSDSYSFSGSSETFTIDWIDDKEPGPSRLLMLEIEQGSGYVRGGQTRHTIILSENDAWWSGVLIDKYAQRNFRMKITNQESAEAYFAAGAGMDGLPVLEGEPEGEESSRSEGVIPPGVHAATIDPTTNWETTLTIESPALPAETNGLFGASAGLTRTLTLTALPNETPPNANDHEISASRIIGTYTECLALPGQANCAEQTGLFVLVRSLPETP